MTREKIKEEILWYLGIYQGDYDATKNKVESYIKRNANTKQEANNSNLLFNDCLSDLEGKGIIALIAYEEMNEQQRFCFDNNNKTYYKIIG